MKDRLENANTGLVKSLEANSKWFSDLSGHLSNEETSILREHLSQAISKLFGAKDQSEAKLKQISNAVRLYVRYHLYAAACREAAILVQDISDALGKKQGTDSDGNPIWSGFIGDLEVGRGMVNAIIDDAENQIALTNEAMKQSHAMYFVLPAPKNKLDEIELLPPKQAREWAESAFSDLGGTEQLFKMLKSDEGRSELLGKLRNRALTLVTTESDKNEINPLFVALDAHPNLGQLFTDLLQRSMPWAAAKVDKYLKDTNPNDQYKCLIGVKNAKEFESRYGREIRSRVPTVTMMTTKEIGFVEIDAPGKLVCYVELSGLPLPSLKALDDWYTSYREETVKIPVHTHRFASTFVHPREITTDELAARSADFTLFVEAVALGVLTRGLKGEDAGLYKLRVKGGVRNIGDERLMRLEGLSANYRPTIQQQVDLDIDEIKSDDQLAMWAALMEYYLGSVYPLGLRRDNGQDLEQKSLPTLLCEKLADKALNRLRSKLGDDLSVERLMRVAREALPKWTEEIQDSHLDVYEYEVNLRELKSKRCLKREVLHQSWLLQTASPAHFVSAHFAATNGISPTHTGMPPPLQEVAFFVAFNNQQTGPHNLAMLQQLVQIGQLTPQTMVWRAGLSNWGSAATMPELMGLFMAPPPLPPAMPPPLP
jgi:hypothetical protein